MIDTGVKPVPKVAPITSMPDGHYTSDDLALAAVGRESEKRRLAQRKPVPTDRAMAVAVSQAWELEYQHDLKEIDDELEAARAKLAKNEYHRLTLQIARLEAERQNRQVIHEAQSRRVRRNLAATTPKILVKLAGDVARTQNELVNGFIKMKPEEAEMLHRAGQRMRVLAEMEDPAPECRKIREQLGKILLPEPRQVQPMRGDE